MAKAALKDEKLEVEEIEEIEEIEESKELEELEVPSGGIGDFALEDDELEEVYSEKAEDYGTEGIAQFPALAERMAKYGRNEDNMLAHVAEGELVIPAQFLEDEVMKQRIYDILTEAGVEDPEAYVVGADANDLNPTTGLPEFFLKKLFKGIKKVLKGVVKVIKKIAPIVLPIVLAMTPLGPIYGAAMGSGIGTLLNGGSIKDALKSALISGAIGGVTAGFTGPGNGSFMSKVGDAASNFGDRVGQTLSGAGSTFTGGGFGGEGNLFSKFDPMATAQIDNLADSMYTGSVVETGAEAAVKQGAETAAKTGAETAVKTGAETAAVAKPPGFMESLQGAVTPGDEVGFFEGMKDAFMPSSGEVSATAGNSAYTEAYNNAMTLPGMDQAGAQAAGTAAQSAAIDAATKAAVPGLLRKFGPTALAGTAIAGGAGFFDVPETERANFLDYNDDGTVTTGRDLIDADPGKFLVKELGSIRLNEETGEYEPFGSSTMLDDEDLTGYAPPQQAVAFNTPIDQQNYLRSSTPGGPFVRPYVTEEYQGAADGGPIFPRRTGGIAPTEGTKGEDSVRAMLMPGEFVMTTDAVRGLGDGNLNNGIKNMYSVMRNLESRGRATA